jgi:RNA polymerase-binding transcription factor DksA
MEYGLPPPRRIKQRRDRKMDLLYNMHDRQLTQVENLCAEREVRRAEIRQLQADLQTLQDSSGMCETCERDIPQ